MYVCLCNNLKCRDFKAASEAGAGTVIDVFKAYGVRPKCGGCLEEAERYVNGQDRGECCTSGTEIQIAAE